MNAPSCRTVRRHQRQHPAHVIGPQVPREHHSANARGSRVAQPVREAVNRAAAAVDVVEHEYVQTVDRDVVDLPLAADERAQAVGALTLPAMAPPRVRDRGELT